MKYVALVICALIAAFMSYTDSDGWGWFILLALLLV